LPAGLLELSVIVPTFNERDNVVPLVERLQSALARLAWEVIFVDDDSPDGTADEIRAVAQDDRRVRCIQRVGRRGLSSAVLEGMLATSAPYLAVLDGDLQHDETLIPRMLDRLKQESLDIVIGSRYMPGGATGDWSPRRAALSRLATRFARLVVSSELTDPMSGFFVITRSSFNRAVHRTSGQGFKILIDLLASSPTPLRFAEIPYTFRERQRGMTKLETPVVWQYVMLLVEKLTGRWLPVRFVLFAAVGACGLVVHLATLRLMLTGFGFSFSQVAATVMSMVSNFSINNALTYRDRRLRGPSFLTGLLTFCAICSIGAVANVRLATEIFERHYEWWLSGLAGAAASVVWNYTVTSLFTWSTE